MSRTREYKEFLFEQLQDPENAVAYLSVALEDEEPRLFLIALCNVAAALLIRELLGDEAKGAASLVHQGRIA